MDRKFQLVAFAAAFALTWCASASAEQPKWLPTLDTIPQGYSGPVFSPRFDFPDSATRDTTPWKEIDFRQDQDGFLKAVLDYLFEGVDQSSGDPATSTARQWYHVPLMEYGPPGREFTHGLTRERNSRSGELGSSHKRCTQSWAVGLYNPTGATTLKRIFGDGTQEPTWAGIEFPLHTVVGKLLFTEATETELPALVGSPVWTANVGKRIPQTSSACPPSDGSTGRTLVDVRLLQLDVSIRVPIGDGPKESPTGWVFGTFIFDGALAEPNPWKQLRPVGLMWGNDPDLTDELAAEGKKPSESIVNAVPGFTRQFGRGGRMNGPVDNPVSACLSCHMTAQFPPPDGASIVPPASKPWSLTGCWFRNLTPRQAFGAPKDGDCSAGSEGQNSLDFSLQLAVAMRNYLALTQRVQTVVVEPKTTKVLAESQRNPFSEPFMYNGRLVLPILRSGELDE
jgi:hypothetical protein